MVDSLLIGDGIAEKVLEFALLSVEPIYCSIGQNQLVVVSHFLEFDIARHELILAFGGGPRRDRTSTSEIITLSVLPLHGIGPLVGKEGLEPPTTQPGIQAHAALPVELLPRKFYAAANDTTFPNSGKELRIRVTPDRSRINSNPIDIA